MIIEVAIKRHTPEAKLSILVSLEIQILEIMFYSENLEIINDIDHCFFSRKNGKSRDTPEIGAVNKLGPYGPSWALLGAPIFLLVLTYIYGQKKLIKLGGPSVEEYRKKIPPPWSSQQSGF